MGTLTDRAERAVLGAMLASPALRYKLGHVVRPGDFHDPWHQHVYQVIVSVSKGGQRDPARLRAAITAADPSITHADLDQLVQDCPDPGHGVAYAAMLVYGYSQRYLADRGRELAARSRQLSRDSDIIRRTDAAGGEAAGAAATHLGRLGDALRAHAATMVPNTTGPSIPVLHYPNTDHARREELVLAAFLHVTPAEADDIRRVLGPSAITDPYRREAFQVISAMVRDGRPVDELTLDWAIAERGLPLQPKGGGATFGQRLAHVPVSLPEALTAAHALQGRSMSLAEPPQLGTAGTRRGTGARRPGHPAGSQLAPILPLRRGGLPPDGPGPGLRPR
jgi:replicative DNA helicase